MLTSGVSIPTGIEVKPDGVIIPSGPGVTRPVGSAAAEGLGIDGITQEREMEEGISVIKGHHMVRDTLTLLSLVFL